MKWTTILIPLLVIPLSSTGGGRTGISFKRERIEASIIACDTFEIKGTYFFENSDSLQHNTSIYYPFPVDSVHTFPYFIELRRSSGRIDTSYIVVDKGIRWRMSVDAQSVDSVTVTYRQKSHSGLGRYILTTTKYWGKPLEHADFTVAVPEGITLSYWSFSSDTLFERNGKLIYGAEKTSFLPREDMLMRWECPADRGSPELQSDTKRTKK